MCWQYNAQAQWWAVFLRLNSVSSQCCSFFYMYIAVHLIIAINGYCACVDNTTHKHNRLSGFEWLYSTFRDSYIYLIHLLYFTGRYSTLKVNSITTKLYYFWPLFLFVEYLWEKVSLMLNTERFKVCQSGFSVTVWIGCRMCCLWGVHYWSVRLSWSTGTEADIKQTEQQRAQG